MKYIFDVDGTLTPSRQVIDSAFEAFMIKFCCKHDVYLVTGSDRQKTVDQLGLDICYRAKSCLLYTSPSPRDRQKSRMPSSA